MRHSERTVSALMSFMSWQCGLFRIFCILKHIFIASSFCTRFEHFCKFDIVLSICRLNMYCKWNLTNLELMWGENEISHIFLLLFQLTFVSKASLVACGPKIIQVIQVLWPNPVNFMCCRSVHIDFRVQWDEIYWSPPTAGHYEL